MTERQTDPSLLHLLSIGAIIPSESPPENLNRAQRRKQLIGRDPQIVRAIGRITATKRELNRTAIEWNQTKEKHPDIIDRIFQPNPFIYDFMAVRRTLPQLMTEIGDVAVIMKGDNIQTFTPDPNDMHFFGGQSSVWTEKINGVSLLDIEGLNLPFGSNEVGTINRLFRVNVLGARLENPKSNHRTIRLAALLLSTQRLVNPEQQVNIPQSVRPLTDRLMAYFDYYTDFFVNPFEYAIDEFKFVSTLEKVQGWVGIGLFAFMPARLGIMPSSIVKLWESRMHSSEQLLGFWHHLYGLKLWRPSLARVRAHAHDAHHKKTLPKDLNQYQYLNYEMDTEAASLLGNYYSDRLVSLDSEDEEEASESFKRRLALYWEPIQDDIYKLAKDHRWNLTMLEEHPVSDVIIASQNRNVLIFILKFKGNPAHLTLELNKKGRLFGVPAKLESEIPAISEFLSADLLGSILEEAQIRFPMIEPVQIEPPQKSEVEAVISHPKPQKQEYTPPVRVNPQESKRVGILTPIQLYLSRDPQLPFPTPQRERVFSVRYSRQQVIDCLGKHASSDVVEQIMKTMRRFEFGGITFSDKIIGTDDAWELKSKEYRIILRHDSGRLYSLVEVGSRDSSKIKRLLRSKS